MAILTDDGSVSPPVPPVLPPDLPVEEPEGPGAGRPDPRRIILPAVLAAPVLLLIILTPVHLSDLTGGLLGQRADPGGMSTLVVLGSVSTVAAIMICRWQPWWALALAVWPYVTVVLAGTFVWAWWPALIAVAVVAAVDDWRRAIPGWAAAVAMGIVYSVGSIPALLPGGMIYVTYPRLYGPGETPVSPGIDAAKVTAYLMAPTVAVLIAAAIGMTRRARRQAVISRRQSAIATATMHRARRAESLAGERARIARDLHDVVAHHISLVAVRAESAPFVHPELPETARDVLDDIAADARQALEELRQVLGVLVRADGERPERRPQPGASDIGALATAAQAAGQAVVLTWSPAGPLAQDVPAAAGYVLYRVVQEALTNARRHAPGREVRVTIGGGPDLVTATIGNEVDPLYRPGPPGRGLIGMRERVTVLGGTLDTGVRDGSFVVELALPGTRSGTGG